MQQKKNASGNDDRVRKLTLPLVMALGLASGSSLASDDSIDYRAQLDSRVEDGSWFSQQLDYFRKYPYLDRAYRKHGSGELDEAASQLQHLLEIDPDDQRVRLMLIQLRLQQRGRDAEVVDLSGQLLARRADFAPAHFYRGLARRRLGDNRLALVDLQRALLAGGLGQRDQQQARSELAEAALAERDYQAVLTSFASGGSGDDYADAWRQGLAQLGLGHYDAAVDALTEAIDLAPEPASRQLALRMLAQVQQQRGDFAAAEAIYRQLLAGEDGQPEQLYRNLAHLAYRLGNNDAAQRWLAQAIQRGEGTAHNDDLARLAALQLESGEVDAAVRSAEAALAQLTATLPEQPLRRSRLRVILGYVALSRELPQQAVQHFAEAAAAAPLDDEALQAQGAALLGTGQPRAALAVLERARSRSAYAVQLEALALESLGEYPRAERRLSGLLGKAADDDPLAAQRELQIALQLARLRRLLGDEAGQIAALDRALELAPRYRGALSSLVEAQRKHGDHLGAAATLRRLLAVDDSLPTRLRLANVLTEGAQREQAIETLHNALDKVVAESTARADIWRRIGVLQGERGDPAAAAEAYAAAFAASDQRDPALLESLAIARQQAEGNPGAIAVLESVWPFESFGEGPRLELGRRLAALQQAEGQPQRAVEVLRSLLADNPELPELNAELASMLRAEGSCAEALRSAGGMAAEEPFSATQSAQAALCYQYAGRPRLATQHGREALAGSASLTVEQQHGLSDLFEQNGADQLALRALRALLGQQRGDAAGSARTLRRIAVIYARKERWHDAAEAYLATHVAQPSSRSTSLGSAATAYQQAGEPAAAIAALQRFAPFADQPRATRLQLAHQLATLLDLEQHSAQAIDTLKAQLERGGAEDKATQQLLARLQHKQADCAAAVASFEASLALGEAQPGEQLLLGLCYQQLGERALAVRHLRGELATNPALSDAALHLLHSSLAHAYASDGLHAQAGEHWAQVRRIEDSPKSALNGATSARLAGDNSAALDLLLEIEPTTLDAASRGHYHDEMAALALDMGDVEAAIEAQRQALASVPNAYRHALLADLLSRRDPHSDAAIEHLQQAIKLQPEVRHYRASLAYRQVARGDDRGAIQAFAGAVQAGAGQRHDEDIAYAHKRLGDNREAAEWFRRAIDRRRDEASVLASTTSGSLGAASDDDSYRLKSEVAQLEDRWHINLGLSMRSRNSGPSSTLGRGSLQSQGGLDVAYRPADIGYRDGRILELYGRGFWDFEDDSLKPDSDSVQAGFGIRYKPWKARNVFFWGERLVAVGDRARDDWMLRASASFDGGTGYEAGRDTWLYHSVYLDAARTLDEGESFYSAAGRLGHAQRMSGRYAMIWHGTLAASGSENDLSSSRSVEAGVGVTIKGWFDEREYRSHRIRLEGGLEYRKVISGDDDGEDSVLLRLTASL